MLVSSQFRVLTRSARPYRSHPRSNVAPHAGRRNFMEGLTSGFLDLAAALPIPPTWPTYSTTIIVSTLAVRFALLPVAVWGRARSRRVEEKVVPELERLKPIVGQEVFQQMQRDRIRGDKEFLKETHRQKCQAILNQKRKELFKEHKCQPIVSMIMPPLVQLPPFIIGTMMLARLSVDPTPFDSESFLTLTTLNHPDPTMVVPILVGMLTMANVESSNWLLNATEKQKQRAVEEQIAKRQAETGEVRIRPGNVIKNALRGLSIVRIVVAAMVPGSVSLYWATSAAFGLLQTWFFDWQDIRRRRLKAQRTEANISAPVSTPALLPSKQARARKQ